MVGKNKFILSVAVGSLLIAFASVATVLGRGKPHYWSERTPLAASHNYLLALKQNDWVQAYDYLSPTLEGYPSLGEFIEQLEGGTRGEHLSFAHMLELGNVGEQGLVEVRVWERRFLGGALELMLGTHEGVYEGIYFGRDYIPEAVLNEIMNRDWDNSPEPFKFRSTRSISDGHFIRSFEMHLQQENGDWKIVGSQTYWMRCWDRADGCE